MIASSLLLLLSLVAHWDLFIQAGPSILSWVDGKQTELTNCEAHLVESIPENLTYPVGAPSHLSTTDAWNQLLGRVSDHLYLAEFYWSLLAEPQFNFNASVPGRNIFEAIRYQSSRVTVRIAQDGAKSNNSELAALSAAGAQIFWIDVPKLLGSGIIHTKLWSVDGSHAYLGSANMDWRSLTEVKELGVLISNCPELVSDLDKIHSAYWIVSQGIPSEWPKELSTIYNRENPMRLRLNGICSRVYFASSPTAFNPPGRTYDLDAILSTISRAEKFIYIAVMEYVPEISYYDEKRENEFWPVIDDALRTAAINRNVEVRLLVSSWRYTPTSMDRYLQSLHVLNGIQDARIRVRYFVVPAYTEEQKQIPFARVNHNKYMVTDKSGYIGTSNWSGSYFLYTGGVGFVFEQDENDLNSGKKSLRQELVELFERDWNSPFTLEL